MPNTQPSFSERTQQMRENATVLLKMSETLADVAAAMHAEADRMTAAEKRFAERRGQKSERRAR